MTRKHGTAPLTWRAVPTCKARRVAALVVVLTLLMTSAVHADAGRPRFSSADHVLAPGEVLLRGQAVSSPGGRFRLAFGLDGDLALYDGSTVLWASGTDGEGADRVVMQQDGALAVYRPPAYGSRPLWSTRPRGYDGAALWVPDTGGVLIRRADSPILWSVELPAPDVGLPGEKHIVYGRGDQMVWLVESDGTLFDSYPVSGRETWPRPGRYEVFSKSPLAWARGGGVSMEHMVRFVKGSSGGGLPTGFHAIPVNWQGKPIQSLDELGLFRSAGCVRQHEDKAALLYEWAPLGTPVVVLA